ncbi:MAG: aminotransferase class I/II-fold pyridoxal phosphate-dependent enzyme [Dehalococcoidia bacterium]|nr:aminotransferase class I/II-fold pyridoxal phosphate-dependent enzyme [Dehalococcoidia bacterium]
MLGQQPVLNSGRKVISRRVDMLSPSGIRKFFDLLSTMEDAISLGVGEPDFATPWNISEAAIDGIEKGYTIYTSNRGLPELRQEVSRKLAARHGVEYNPETELLITVGVSEALDLALRAIVNPRDEVISPEPTYVSYSSCTILAGGTFVPVPTTAENGFRVKADDLEKRVTPRTKAILLGYPNNPTGAVMEKDDLLEIAELVHERDLVVISDEIYDQLVYGVNHTCFASLPFMKERTILLGGFSKSYAMTGWRVGYAAAPAEIIEAMTKIHQYTMLCAPIMGQKAAIEALRSGDGSVKEMVDDYNRRRRVMVKGFNTIGLTCFEPRGAFYAFPSIRITGMTSQEFAEKLLLEQKVAVVPGSAFGASGEGHVRCCYATALPDIREALRRMRRFVQAHRA